MPEEIDAILEQMDAFSVYESGKRRFVLGQLAGRQVVVALSRIGKVAAAVTAAVMFEKFDVSQIILTGVAGALSPALKIGDIVIATSCVQHDLDARPLFRRFEAPLLGQAFFKSDTRLTEITAQACRQFLTEDLEQTITPEHIFQFNLNQIEIHEGLLCCGDQFIGSDAQREAIRKSLPEALCVEMECGAVGQVCYEYGVPFVAVRTISDGAGQTAQIDFNQYINCVSKYYTAGIIKRILPHI